jgi:hypothetical protein
MGLHPGIHKSYSPLYSPLFTAVSIFPLKITTQHDNSELAKRFSALLQANQKLEKEKLILEVKLGALK